MTCPHSDTEAAHNTLTRCRTCGKFVSAKRIELGSGQRPTAGYAHNDINPFDGIDLVCNPWEIDFASGSVEEIIALGVIEHLAYADAAKTVANVHRLLATGGKFYFDVPDLAKWCGYLTMESPPFELTHIMATLYGWQRWPGDEHKSGWVVSNLQSMIRAAGFTEWQFVTGAAFIAAGLGRTRMARPEDAHLYIIAEKT